MNELDPVHIDDSHLCIPCFERLRQENLEQARLLGISGSHEAKLLADNERLQSEVDLLVHDQRKRIDSWDKLYTENERLKAELAKTSHEMWNDKRERAEMLESRDAWKARAEKLVESLMLTLPMAKGYAAEHHVGCNQSLCSKADDVLTDYAKATEGKGK